MEITLAELVETIGGEIAGDGSRIIRGIAPFDAAGENDITFAENAGTLRRIPSSDAGAIIVPKNYTPQQGNENLVYADSPRLVFARALNCFFPGKKPAPGISSRSAIGKNFKPGKDVSIGAFVFIGDNVAVGDRTCLHPGVFIGDGVEIGEDTEIFPNVTIREGCIIGSRVIVHSGSVIGSDGYGFVPDRGRHFKIQQTGIVQIGDDTEIGALNAIDRATFGRTWIKEGVKTDNSVHIGHNVEVGENTLIVAQAGIAGSTRIGKNVTIAGKAGIGGHIEIGDNAVIGPRAGVTRSVAEGDVVSGTPEMPHRLWLKVSRIIPRLPEIKKKVDWLDAAVKKMASAEDEESREP